MQRLVIGLFTVVLLLAACRGPEAPPALIPTTPTSTSTPAPAPIPTPTATPTSTATPSPTATPQPTATPVPPTPTPRPTATPTATPTPTPVSVSRTIQPAEGGTLALPDGSSASIPAGVLSADQTVTLTLQPALTQQPSNQAITTVGPSLSIVLEQRTAAASFWLKLLPFLNTAQAATHGSMQVTLNLASGGAQDRLNGSVPVAVADVDGAPRFLGLSGRYDSSSNTATMTVPLPLPGNVKRAQVGLANLRPLVESAPLPTPGAKSWNGSRWIDSTPGFDNSKKTLVLVHGMRSSVEDAWPDPTCLSAIAKEGGYQQVVGFNYNWTQGIEQSGRELANFLNTLRAAGVKEVDVEAHSEGVPVTLSAYAKTDLPVQNMVLKGGPIMGTPAATRGAALTAALQGVDYLATTLLNWSSPTSLPIPMLGGRRDVTLEQVVNGDFTRDLIPDSDALKYTRGAVAQKMDRPGSNTKLVAVAGTDHTQSTAMSALGKTLKGLLAFATEPFDGIVGVDSALGKGSGLRITSSQHPLSHTDLECSPAVIHAVGTQLSALAVVPTPTPTPTPQPTPTPTRVPPTPTPLPPATLSVSPSSAAAGDVVTVSGQSFTPNGTITTLTIGGLPVLPASGVTVKADGTFTTNIVVSTQLDPRTYTVSARDNAGKAANAPLVVAAPATLTVSPSSAAAGAVVTVTGQGFTANGTMTSLTVAGIQLSPPTGLPIQADGTFRTNIFVPTQLGAGIYILAATDSAGKTASATVFVTAPTPTPTPTPPSVALAFAITSASCQYLRGTGVDRDFELLASGTASGPVGARLVLPGLPGYRSETWTSSWGTRNSDVSDRQPGDPATTTWTARIVIGSGAKTVAGYVRNDTNTNRVNDSRVVTCQ